LRPPDEPVGSLSVMRSIRQHTLDLSPLRASRDFRLLLAGSAVSALGSGLTRVAIPLQVYALTNSSWKVGLVGALSIGPVLVSSILGGAMADISDRRRMLLITLLVGAVLSLALTINVAIGEAPVRGAAGRGSLVALYVLAVMVGVNGAFASPANRSAVPVLLPAAQLPAAQALQMFVYTGAGVIAPAAAGLLYASVGPAWTYGLDALSFGACFVAVLGMQPIPKGNDGERFHPGLVLEGFRSLRGRHAVQGSFVADLIAMVFGMPLALFPAIAAQRFGGRPKLVGLLYAALPFGMMVAAALSGWTRRVHRYGRVLVGSIVGWGIAITVMGLVDGVALTLGCLALAGAADAVSGVARTAMLQLATPPSLQGRMQGVGMAVWITGPYLGDVEAGGVAALTSVDASIVIGGVACVAAIALLAKVRPAFARFDSHDVGVVD
jgi:MFS family permease